jgi:integrase
MGWRTHKQETGIMASVADDANGRRRILFVAPDQKRKTIRLGKTDRRTADGVARHVETLLAALIGGQPVARETAVWLTTVPAKLKQKLAAVGLIEGEKTLTAGEYLAQWLKGKRDGGYKPASLIAWGQTVKELTDLLGERQLHELTHNDGEAYRTAMRDRQLRPTTINKRLIHARQMLEDAVRHGHISVNPWEHVKQRQGDPSERRAYVAVADVQRVIEHCPNVWWKLLVALARFAGLRTPSEPFSLTWGDVDWERGRLSVPSPKTEGTGKPHRVIPLFRLLRPHLEAAFEHAEESTEFVFPIEYRQRAHGPAGWVNANLRTTFGKVIRRGRRTMAAAVALTPRELRIGPRPNVPAGDGDEVARQHAVGGAASLRRSDGNRVREGRGLGAGKRRKIRRTSGAKCGAAGTRGESHGVERRGRKRTRSGVLCRSVRVAVRR